MNYPDHRGVMDAVTHNPVASQKSYEGEPVNINLDRVTLNPSNPFEAVLIKMVETHRAKAQDYAGDAHPNQNFYDTATQLGLTAGHSVEALIATKQARLKVLLPRFWKAINSDAKSTFNPVNEAIDDTLLDRAVYSVIALTIWNEYGFTRAQAPRRD